MERVEDVLDAMGLRTFEAPMTLNFRKGCFEAEEGLFRCFVNEDDVERALSYLELQSDQVYWITLEYPGYELLWEDIVRIAKKSRRIFGRIHAATFIIAVENSIDKDRARLESDFAEFCNSQQAGTYYFLSIWDEAGLHEEERQLQEKERTTP